jgi:hypothetical protein
MRKKRLGSKIKTKKILTLNSKDYINNNNINFYNSNELINSYAKENKKEKQKNFNGYENLLKNIPNFNKDYNENININKNNLIKINNSNNNNFCFKVNINNNNNNNNNYNDNININNSIIINSKKDNFLFNYNQNDNENEINNQYYNDEINNYFYNNLNPYHYKSHFNYKILDSLINTKLDKEISNSILKLIYYNNKNEFLFTKKGLEFQINILDELNELINSKNSN